MSQSCLTIDRIVGSLCIDMPIELGLLLDSPPMQEHENGAQIVGPGGFLEKYSSWGIWFSQHSRTHTQNVHRTPVLLQTKPPWPRVQSNAQGSRCVPLNILLLPLALSLASFHHLPNSTEIYR